MPRQRSPERDKAFEMYKQSNRTMKLKDIAEKIGVSDVQVRKWKNQDKWDEQTSGNVSKKNGNVTKRKGNVTLTVNGVEMVPKVQAKIPDEDELDLLGLNDRRRLFVQYYIAEPNATQAAIKAGYSEKTSGAIGHELLKNPKVRHAIRSERLRMESEVEVTNAMIINQLWKIASADINDFVEFEELPPARFIDEDTGKISWENRQAIKVRSSDDMEGTLIAEVRQTKDGIAFKRYDAMDALKTLAKIKGMLTDNVNVKHSGEVRQVNEQRYHVIQEIIEKKPDLVREIFGRDRIGSDT